MHTYPVLPMPSERVLTTILYDLPLVGLPTPRVV